MAANDDSGLEELRVAVMGMGRIGRLHAENLKELGVGSIVGVDIGDHYPAQGEVDAMVVSSWSAVHFEHIEHAAKIGVPVYCEKPLCDSWDKSVECARMCEQEGVPLMMGFQRRFDGKFERVKEGSGKVAPVRNVLIVSRDPSPPPAEYMQQMGSHFMDMTIHDYDEARWLLEEEPVSVYATVTSDKMRAFVLLRTESERMCQIVNSRHCAFGYDQRVEVFGDNGRAAEDGLPEDSSAFFVERYKEAYKRALHVFLSDVVLGKKPPPIGPRDALMASLLAQSSERSSQEGREVHIPPLEL